MVITVIRSLFWDKIDISFQAVLFHYSTEALSPVLYLQQLIGEELRKISFRIVAQSHGDAKC